MYDACEVSRDHRPFHNPWLLGRPLDSQPRRHDPSARVGV